MATAKHKPAWIEALQYAALRTAASCVTLGDLGSTLYVAKRFGRWFGSARFNRKRLQRAIDNISVAFPEWSPEVRREYALRSYEHICGLGIEMANMPRRVSFEGWVDRVELGDVAGTLRKLLDDRPIIFLTGHTGNWELNGYTMALLGFRIHAPYRPLDLRPADEWVRRVRSERGMVLVDKFGAMSIMPELLKKRLPIGMVADQNAGVRGLHVPFFGRLASTYKAIAIMALMHDAVIVTCMAKRVGGRIIPGTGVESEPYPMRYHMYVADIFGPEDYRKQTDPSFYITARFRRGLEDCIRQAPEQTLWMHRYWKSRPHHELAGKPFPARLEERLRNLPWMTDDELARIKEHSARDAAECARNRPEPEPDELAA